MISFELSEEQEIARAAVGTFARQVLRPLARQVDDAGALSTDILNQLWALGFVQLLIDPSPDAPASAAITSAIVLEELGWADAVFGVALGGPLGFVRAIVEQGSAAQRQRLLPLFCERSYHDAAVAIAEPGFLGGGGTGTTAEGDAKGYRLNGAKIQIPRAAHCSHFLVVAKLDGKSDAFIVAADAPGVSVQKPEGNLGLHALQLATVHFDNVRVEREMRLGGNQGADVRRIVDCGLAGASSILVGVCRGVYEHSVAYTKERVAHGSALARKQSVAFRLVDMFVEAEASRWMCWRAASHLDKRLEATRSAVLAHTYTTEQSAWITDEGVQLMGGHGFVRDNPVELWYRNAKTLAMLEGIASV